jgi:ABC-type multidrug transport system fused ATPase/permease subunit
MSTTQPVSGFSTLLRLSVRYPRLLVIIFALALLCSLATTPAPYLGKIIIDELIFKGGAVQSVPGAEAVVAGEVGGFLGLPSPVWMLAALVALGVALKLFAALLQGWQSHYILQITRNVLHELRLKTALHLMGVPQSYFERNAPARLAARLTHDVTAMDGAIFTALRSLVTSVFLILTIVGFMVWIDGGLTVVVLLTMPLTALLTMISFRWLHAFSRQESDRMAGLAETGTEIFGGLKIIRAFGAEPYFLKRFQARSEALRYEGIRHWTVFHTMNALLTLVSGLGADLFLLVGGYLAFMGRITFGEFFAFYGYQAMLWAPIGVLLNSGNLFQTGSASAEKVMELQAVPREDYLEREHSRVSPDFRGRIVCENLGFHYHAEEPVLRGLDLVIKPGTVTALVGQSGSGKTTLAGLLMGLHLPTTGKLLIDDIDVRQWDLRALRGHIGVVLQDHLLFDDTLRANLTLGREFSDKEIRAALAAAHLDDFIERLPDGLDTRLGVAGSRLSGGQKQRIAIARIFLRDPKLLILDEATSALDSETEKAIQRSFDALLVGRTSVIIAHRLSTIYQADQIVVLHQGRIVEIGTHEQLLAREAGHYRELYAAQVGGMIPMSGATRRAH